MELEEISQEMQRVGVISHDSDQFIEDMAQFENYGGQIHILSQAHSITPISVLPSDDVFSICHEGWNRSQILCEAIHGVKRVQAMNPNLCDYPVPMWICE